MAVVGQGIRELFMDVLIPAALKRIWEPLSSRVARAATWLRVEG
jgi:hypothetical protein